MKRKSKNAGLFCRFLLAFCFVSLSSINLFGQGNDESRIGVCNVATESKPIEIESDTPNYSIAYPNLSEAFYAINQGIHTGEINVEVCFDSVEREAAILKSAETKSANYSKVSIRPLKDDLTISAKTGYNAMIALNGTDNVTINGDNPNTKGINRNLTLHAWGGRSVVAIQTRFHSRNKYDSARNNKLKNLIISSKATSSYGIAMGGHNPGSSGFLNHNNSIINNAFRRLRTGIFSGGKSPTQPNVGTIISKNDLSVKGKDRVRLVGIHLEYETNAKVTENQIGGLESPKGTLQDQVGIRLGGGKMSSLAKRCTERCYRSISDSLIEKNIIDGVIGGERQSVAGIYVYGYGYFPNKIQNNVIKGVKGLGLRSNVTAGIFVAGQNESKIEILNNTVSMTGEYGSKKIHNPSYAVVFLGTDISISMFNNTFSNTQTAKLNSWAKSYVGGFVLQHSKAGKSPFELVKSNNNTFYSNGENADFMRLNSLKRREGTDIKTLNNWRKTSANDSDSQIRKPETVGSLKLHTQ